METLFYVAAAVAIISTLMVITRYSPVHALLYLVVSFLSAAMVFLSVGAPFVAALEVIVYTGGIIVLFIFVVMMLNLGKETAWQEKQWLRPKVWAGPGILCLILLVELGIELTRPAPAAMNLRQVPIKQVSISLY